MHNGYIVFHRIRGFFPKEKSVLHIHLNVVSFEMAYTVASGINEVNIK